VLTKTSLYKLLLLLLLMMMMMTLTAACVRLLNNVMCVSCSPTTSQDKRLVRRAPAGVKQRRADPDVCSLTPLTDCACSVGPPVRSSSLRFMPLFSIPATAARAG